MIGGESAAGAFYRSLFSFVLAALRFGKMSCGTSQGRDNLIAIEFLESELTKKGPQSAKLMSGFVKPGGSFCDQTLCLSPEFDLKSELMRGRIKALTKNGLSGMARFKNFETHVLFL